MAVIKCSNCENEILDTEIVCPYCDCPISETIKKMKKDDLESYSSKSIDSLTGKIPAVTPKEEPKIATSSDFAKEKAAILRDLGIKIPDEKDAEAPNKEELVTPDKETVSEEKAAENVNTPANEEIPPVKEENAPAAKEKTIQAEANMGTTVKISRNGTIENKVKTRKNTHGAANKSAGKSAADRKIPDSQKKSEKKSKSKYIVLGITIIGIVVVIYLIMGIADTISDGINKTKKVNKTVTVVDSSASSDADSGYEIHSSTLTITDDEVMKDYDSPQDTPWFEYRDKIKHVTFGKKVTKIGAHAFEGFENITDINISDSVKTIGESAFCNCTSLTKITNMSKNIEEIGDYAFTGCKNLSKIPGYTEEADFEPTVERIGIEAFKSCKSLEAFKLPMYTEIDTDAFFGHSDEFVLICERTSDAYAYATEKGIPTKTSFDSETLSSETYTAPVTSQTTTQTNTSGTKNTETKTDETDDKAGREEGDNASSANSDNNNDDDKKDESKQTPQGSGAPAGAPSTGIPSASTPSTGSSNVPVAGIAPSGSNAGGSITQGGSVGTPNTSNPASDVGKLTDNFNQAQTDAEKDKALSDIAKVLN